MHRVLRILALSSALLSSAFLSAALVAYPASADPDFRVAGFAPTGQVRDVGQIRVRFTADVVPLGRLAAADPPIEADCPIPGEGRWLTPREWALDLPDPLPPGLACRVTVMPLTSLDGRQLSGTRTFAFATGGARLLQARPWPGSIIEEDQAFLLILDTEADPESVVREAHLRVEGLASRVDLTLVDEATTARIVEAIPFYGEVAAKPKLVVAPVLRLPRGRAVDLVWSRAILTPSGVPTGDAKDAVYSYRVREPFSVSATCRRLPQSDTCDALSDITLVFTEAVAAEQAAAVRLGGPDGRQHAPRSVGDGDTTRVAFPGPFLPNTAYDVRFPDGFQDRTGRAPATRTLLVRVGDYPPLAKFAADFGILEARADPALPLTVRNVEPDLAATLALEGAYARIGPDAAAPDRLERIVRVLQRLDRPATAGERYRRPVLGELGLEPVTARITVPRTTGHNETEVVGIPLPESGFYVVELASKVLAEAILYDPTRLPREVQPSTMYVAAAALVTDLAVHLKLADENGLLWVTRLSDGEPVADARLTALDCAGRRLWTGRSGEDGVALIDSALPSESCPDDSGSEYGHGLFVFAEQGGDIGLVHTSWNQGLERWRFGGGFGWRWPGAEPVLAHTVFGRTLLRAGESLSMRHVARRQDATGLSFLPDYDGLAYMEIVHSGSDQSYTFPLTWQDDGAAVAEWRIPESARLGTYDVYLKAAADTPIYSSLRTGSVQVQEFKIPLLESRIALPVPAPVGPAPFPVAVQVDYFGGGPAAELPVTLRMQSFPDWTSERLGGHPGYRFDAGPVRQVDDADRRELVQQELTLDAAGSGRAVLPAPDQVERAQRLLVEAEYRDPNGEVQTTARSLVWRPHERRIGIRLSDDSLAEGEPLEIDVIVIDADGNPVADAVVAVESIRQRYLSHRKKLVGGLYAYEHETVYEQLGELCRGPTGADGRLSCPSVAESFGSQRIEARIDSPGSAPTTHAQLWVYGDGRAWFDASDSDRMDIVPERERWEPGETARIRLEIPFARATALVTAEREGVLSHHMVTVEGEQPIVSLPIARAFAPNIEVGVLAVRGRIDDVRPTGLIDLGKPAFKVGRADLHVGWSAHELAVTVETDRDVYPTRGEVQVRIAVTAPADLDLPPGATAAIAVVDEALLALAPNESWNLLEAMMAPRPGSVETYTAQMHVVGKRHFGLKAIAEGGGGGLEPIRELFDTLVYWNGHVVLDADGRARVSFRLGDALTRFRVVAVAQAGRDLFGTGAATISAHRDLFVAVGLPPLVREGDRFAAAFTLRNGTGRTMSVQATLESDAPIDDAAERSLTLVPGEARTLRWPVQVPAGPDGLSYVLTVREDGTIVDRLAASQRVEPVEPVRVLQSTLVRAAPGVELPVERPAGALPGRGGIGVTLSATLAGGLGGVRDYMARYPFTCFEQRASRVVALDDRAGWDLIVAAVPAYLDGDGLLKFFPALDRGDPELTSYILRIADATGWPIPPDYLARMTGGLRAFLDGGLGERRADARMEAMRRVSALDALARHGAADATLLETIALNPPVEQTETLLDWLGAVDRIGASVPAEVRADVATQIRSRLRSAGDALTLAEPGPPPAALMRSAGTAMARLVLDADLIEPGEGHAALVLRGLLGMRERGHWGLTTANALAAAAVRRFAVRYDSDPVAGTTVAALGAVVERVSWRNGDAVSATLPWPAESGVLTLDHRGAGAPWATVDSRAAVPVERALQHGLGVQKSLMPIVRKRDDVWSVGDIVRIRLEMTASAPAGWVAVSDPIPAGATILGRGIAGDSEIGADGERHEGRWPDWEERAYAGLTAYYGSVAPGRWALEYTYRLNADGVFGLPPTRIEALYAPQIHGILPHDAPILVVE